MKTAPLNPAKNVLPPGIKDEDLLKGIEKSGYPLQSAVATKLLQHQFSVAEEWGYLDKSSRQEQQRSLDLIATRFFATANNVTPRVLLLVECKRSEHPYVFFKKVSPTDLRWFPHIGGYLVDQVALVQPIDAVKSRTQTVSRSTALGLKELPFLSQGPEMTASFTKATPSGNRVDLSGDEPFNRLILPLRSAFEALTEIDTKSNSTVPLSPAITLCVAVLDAPMVLVQGGGDKPEPILTPWVRVIRQESNPENPTPGYLSFRYYAIDAVHLDYLDEFLRDKLTPFANEFASRAAKQRDVLIGGGNVSDIDNWKWTEIK